tara:strand:+ start:17 stop:499 length:483 start_codon:yes stop_codon:yes gene_type:complete
MVMNKNKQTNKGNTMIKEKAIDIELSEIVREFENMSNDKIAERFELRTFQNGKIKFHYKNHKHIYFNVHRISHSYDKYGYDLEIDFYQKLLPKESVRVLKDIEDYKIYLEPFHENKFKKFLCTDLYKFFDDIVDLNNHINLNNLNASDAYRVEKSITTKL